jgi:ArsR family transcriptional regulator
MLNTKQIAKIRKSFDGDEQRLVFKTMGDTNRYHIVVMLRQLPQLAVGDMAKILEISIPLASQHLKILTHAKILEKEKLGQKVFYKLRSDNKIIKAIIERVI